MKHSRFTDQQIIGILKEQENGPRTGASTGYPTRLSTNTRRSSVAWRFPMPAS